MEKHYHLNTNQNQIMMMNNIVSILLGKTNTIVNKKLQKKPKKEKVIINIDHV